MTSLHAFHTCAVSSQSHRHDSTYSPGSMSAGTRTLSRIVTVVGQLGSAYELKQAVVEACLANLGPDGTPALWLEGDLDTMAVQFLDSETGSAVTLKESTDFGRILAARTVRVTKREFKQPKTLTHRADVELGAVNMED